MVAATVLADASFDDRRNLGGWAAWVRLDTMSRPVVGYGSFKQTISKSHLAEVQAAINGMHIAWNRGAQKILLRSDCLAVDSLVRGTSKDKAAIALWNEGLYTMRGLIINSRHVKGHQTGELDRAGWVNNWVDKHARKGLNAARGGKKLLYIGAKRDG